MRLFTSWRRFNSIFKFAFLLNLTKWDIFSLKSVLSPGLFFIYTVSARIIPDEFIINILFFYILFVIGNCIVLIHCSKKELLWSVFVPQGTSLCTLQCSHPNSRAQVCIILARKGTEMVQTWQRDHFGTFFLFFFTMWGYKQVLGQSAKGSS